MNTQIKIIKGDITEINADIIVNAANNHLRGGGGVDSAIHRAAGTAIKEECRKIGYCNTGEAVITSAGNLEAKYIIHTVGPVYTKNNNEQQKLLYNAYYKSLQLGKEYNAKTIAFPSISTGVYGYPFIEASTIALQAINDFIINNCNYDEIIFVLFSTEDYLSFIELKDKIL